MPGLSVVNGRLLGATNLRRRSRRFGIVRRTWRRQHPIGIRTHQLRKVRVTRGGRGGYDPEGVGFVVLQQTNASAVGSWWTFSIGSIHCWQSLGYHGERSLGCVNVSIMNVGLMLRPFRRSASYRPAKNIFVLMRRIPFQTYFLIVLINEIYDGLRQRTRTTRRHRQNVGIFVKRTIVRSNLEIVGNSILQ